MSTTKTLFPKFVWSSFPIAVKQWTHTHTQLDNKRDAYRPSLPKTASITWVGEACWWVGVSCWWRGGKPKLLSSLKPLELQYSTTSRFFQRQRSMQSWNTASQHGLTKISPKLVNIQKRTFWLPNLNKLSSKTLTVRSTCVSLKFTANCALKIFSLCSVRELCSSTYLQVNR